MSVLKLPMYLSVESNCIGGLSLGLMRAVTLEWERPSVCARFALRRFMRIIAPVCRAAIRHIKAGGRH